MYFLPHCLIVERETLSRVKCTWFWKVGHCKMGVCALCFPLGVTFCEVDDNCIQDLNWIFYYLPITKNGTIVEKWNDEDDDEAKSSIIFHVIIDKESSTGPNKVQSCKEGNNIILMLWFFLWACALFAHLPSFLSSTQVHLHRSSFFSDYDSLKLV